MTYCTITLPHIQTHKENSHHFTEHENSLPFSQESIYGCYFWARWIQPHFFKLRFGILPPKSLTWLVVAMYRPDLESRPGARCLLRGSSPARVDLARVQIAAINRPQQSDHISSKQSLRCIKYVIKHDIKLLGTAGINEIYSFETGFMGCRWGAEGAAFKQWRSIRSTITCRCGATRVTNKLTHILAGTVQTKPNTARTTVCLKHLWVYAILWSDGRKVLFLNEISSMARLFPFICW